MGGKKEIYRDVRFFHGALQLIILFSIMLMLLSLFTMLMKNWHMASLFHFVFAAGQYSWTTWIS